VYVRQVVQHKRVWLWLLASGFWLRLRYTIQDTTNLRQDRRDKTHTTCTHLRTHAHDDMTLLFKALPSN